MCGKGGKDWECGGWVEFVVDGVVGEWGFGGVCGVGDCGFGL